MKSLTSKKLRSVILETLNKTKILNEEEEEPGESILQAIDRPESIGTPEIIALTKAIKVVGGDSSTYGKLFKRIRKTIREKADPTTVEKDFQLLQKRASDIDFLEFDLALDSSGQEAFKDAVKKAGAQLSSMHKAKEKSEKEIAAKEAGKDSIAWFAQMQKDMKSQANKKAIAKYTSGPSMSTEAGFEEMLQDIEKTIDEKEIPAWEEIYSGGGASGWSDSKWKEFLDTARQKGLLSKSVADEAAKSWPKAAKAIGMTGNLEGAQALYATVATGKSKLKSLTISESFKLNRRTIRNLILQEIKRSGGL